MKCKFSKPTVIFLLHDVFKISKIQNKKIFFINCNFKVKGVFIYIYILNIFNFVVQDKAKSSNQEENTVDENNNESSIHLTMSPSSSSSMKRNTHSYTDNLTGKSSKNPKSNQYINNK